MTEAASEARASPLRVAIDRRLKLEFHGARITSDGGLLADRELDDALGLTAMAASALAEGRRGNNIRHQLLGLLRQAIYGRPAGYEESTTPSGPPATRPCAPSWGGRARPALGLEQRDGLFRERVARRGGEPRRAHRPVRAWIDRVHRRRAPDGHPRH
jgi:Transposase DDE domain group 1